jgi:hypothetical protein
MQEENQAAEAAFSNNHRLSLHRGLDTNQPYGGGTGFHPANPIN